MPDQGSTKWEPQLKYNELEADAPLILARDEASAFQTSDKLHVLGCASGRVHVLDFEGNKVKTCMQHDAQDREYLSCYLIHLMLELDMLEARASSCACRIASCQHTAQLCLRSRSAPLASMRHQLALTALYTSASCTVARSSGAQACPAGRHALASGQVTQIQSRM